ncbi:growth arrest and DNA damage-inducible protein GADD45 alpha-like [Littorina saxatilis]|uniref:Ribosomal protein L7Ae/L30e/S12e/Gadd45 domain-containing protein n=1 Tax=Littorina saxatilis TaxID=31220 RepID=A0AAN9B6T2_9CAEN
MTFTEMCSACDTHCEKSSSPIGQALEKCISRAMAAQRVTVGVQECAKLLGCAPERVMLCLIPDMNSSPDVGMHIQHTLVRSFCWENDIRLLTVKDTDKLRSLLDSAREDVASPSADEGSKTKEGESQPSNASCVLVEMPKEDLSLDEEFICNYHDTIIYSDIYPKPIIQLPV